MTSEQFQELRHAVLDVLVTRHPTALTEDAIARRIVGEQSLDFQFDEPAQRSALEFLHEKGLIKMRQDGLGSTRYWTATADGQLFHERG
jgi:hypothetical protein